MSSATLTDDHYNRDTVTVADIAMLAESGYTPPYAVGERVGPKFSSVAAMVLWQWSLESGQDETAGDAQYGNGWNALFRDERAILNTGNSAFVSAWRIADGDDVETVWAEIEAGAVYEDDYEEEGDGE